MEELPRPSARQRRIVVVASRAFRGGLRPRIDLALHVAAADDSPRGKGPRQGEHEDAEVDHDGAWDAG
jgi:hypothetical protein